MSQSAPIQPLPKIITWRALGSLTTFVVVWALTANVNLALIVVALEIATKTGLFFLHERHWNKRDRLRSEPKPAVLWFTGLSGAGKTTIAKHVHQALKAQGVNVAWLDGDVTRDFFPRTGFSKEERNAHVVRSGFIARMLAQHGVTVVASYISPYADTRKRVRDMCAEFADFIEVFVCTPLQECERRDVKGLYAKARRGEITQFTGIDDPYEKPENPEIVIETMDCSPAGARNCVLRFLRDVKGWPVTAIDAPDPANEAAEGSLHGEKVTTDPRPT